MNRLRRILPAIVAVSVVAATWAAPVAAQSPSASPAPAPSIVATVPPDQLEFPDKLVICSDLPYPPQEYFDADGNPIGSDIEIGQGIAARLGLTAQVENSVFDTIIPALTGGKCDIILSAQNIKPDRLAQVDMIPYFQAGQGFLVQAGNPENIQTTQDLCGKKIAAETGTTQLDYVAGTGEHTTNGLPSVCAAAGQPAPEAQPYTKDSDAVAALQAGAADAYMSDLPVVIGYATAQPDQFAQAPVPQIDPAPEGISVAKTNTGLRDAVKAALLSMMNDGSYMSILTKYSVETGAITADQVDSLLPSPAPSEAPSASPS